MVCVGGWFAVRAAWSWGGWLYEVTLICRWEYGIKFEMPSIPSSSSFKSEGQFRVILVI